MSTTEFGPPHPVMANRRRVPEHTLEIALRADDILKENGEVHGTEAVGNRSQARWRAQWLIKLLVELDLYKRWQLSEHVYKLKGRWFWSVIYEGRGGNSNE